MKAAKTSFLEVYNFGRDQLVAEDDEEYEIAFAELSQRHGIGTSPKITEEKSTRRTTLKTNLSMIRAIEGTFDPDTLEKEPKILIPETAATSLETKDRPKLVLKHEVATTHRKLIGLRDDSRAGFLPTTHIEKNQGYELLDYAIKSPLPADTRLGEIFTHKLKEGREKGLLGTDLDAYAEDTTRSIIVGWGDFVQNATVSLAELLKLKVQLTSGLSPRISLMQATEPEAGDTFDYAVLVRFANLKSLRDGHAIAIDPLKNRENRTIIHPDKNKIIEDRYTAIGDITDVQNFIDDAAEALTLKDGLSLIDEAITDQQRRQQFWITQLSSLRKPRYAPLAQRVLREVAPKVDWYDFG